MTFTNPQIQTEDLPNVEDVVLKPISKSYLKIIALNGLAFYSLILGVLLFLGGILTMDKKDVLVNVGHKTASKVEAEAYYKDNDKQDCFYLGLDGWNN